MVAIVGQTNRSAMGGSYQQEIDLLSLYKDVASDYVQMITVAEQLPNVLDRAIRTAVAERAPTALIIPADVQELPYSPPTHAFNMPPIPPHATFEQFKATASAVLGGDEDRWGFIKEGVKTKAQELLPHLDS